VFVGALSAGSVTTRVRFGGVVRRVLGFVTVVGGSACLALSSVRSRSHTGAGATTGSAANRGGRVDHLAALSRARRAVVDVASNALAVAAAAMRLRTVVDGVH
jgi:hypothetical protein